MPSAFVAVLVALGLGLCIGAACGAAGAVYGMVRASKLPRETGEPPEASAER